VVGLLYVTYPKVVWALYYYYYPFFKNTGFCFPHIKSRWRFKLPSSKKYNKE